MKKKVFFISLLFILVIAPRYAMASYTPLESASRNTVSLKDSEDISLVSFYSYLTVRSGFTSVNSSMVIKNEINEDREVLIGLPAQIDNRIRSIRDLTVTVNGQNIRTRSFRDATDTDEISITDMPRDWLVFTVNMDPLSSIVIESSFTIDNTRDEHGTSIVLLPLELMNGWKGTPEYIQITADLDFYPPYVFDPKPSLSPDEYNEMGRLTWRMRNVHSLHDLEFYFRPTDTIVVNFLEQIDTNSSEIKNIIGSFKIKDYESTIELIRDFIDENPLFEYKEELFFMQALAYQGLYQINHFTRLLDRLDGEDMFGDVSSTISNWIIYERYMILKNHLNESSDILLEYLQETKDNIQNNDIFLGWMEDEIHLLTEIPDPIVEEPVEEVIVEEQPEENLVQSIELFGYEIPVEFLFLGIIVIIVIILLTTRKRKRPRSYLFR